MAAVKQPECRQKRKSEKVAAAGGDRGIDTECKADTHYTTQLLPKDALHLALRTDG